MLKFNVVTSRNNGGISIILEENEKAIEVFVRSSGEKRESNLKVFDSIVESNC